MTMASPMRLPCHPSARHMALSTSLRWLEAQDDCDPVRLQLVHSVQQNAAMKRSTKLTQRRVTSFFSWLMRLHEAHVVIARSTSWIIKFSWINLIIHNLNFPYPRLSERFFVVPTSSDNRGWTVQHCFVGKQSQTAKHQISIHLELTLLLQCTTRVGLL